MGLVRCFYIGFFFCIGILFLTGARTAAGVRANKSGARIQIIGWSETALTPVAVIICNAISKTGGSVVLYLSLSLSLSRARTSSLPPNTHGQLLSPAPVPRIFKSIISISVARVVIYMHVCMYVCMYVCMHARRHSGYSLRGARIYSLSFSHSHSLSLSLTHTHTHPYIYMYIYI